MNTIRKQHRFPTHTGAILCSALLAMSLTGCSSTGKSAALGAGIGAVVGGAAGYMIAGEQGALVGAGAGALLGAGTGYAIGKQKEKQNATEEQLRQEAAASNAPVTQPVIAITSLTATPTAITPGSEVNLAINLRAVGTETVPVQPPAVQVSILREGQVLKTQELTAENTGDVTITASFPTPSNAQPGTYQIKAITLAQGTVLPSEQMVEFQVTEAQVGG